MQMQRVEQDLHALLPNNPFIPPKGDVCFINNLPPELLSRIFEVGAANTDNEDEDDTGDYLENLCNAFDAKEEDEKDSHDADGDMTEGREDASLEGDDEETDDDDNSDATESSDLGEPPFQIVVSHVCHHWRNVALSTPSLWTTIDVAPESRPPYLAVSTLLERSKGLPINISIDCEPLDSEGFMESLGPSPADLTFLYNLLTPHVHRWRTIEVSVSHYKDMFLFLNAISDPSISAAPQLMTLQLYHHEDTDEFTDFPCSRISQHFTLFGGCAPCLTHIVLWGVHVDWDQPWISSAPRLVELELAFHPENVRPTWDQLATILRGTSSLEKLSLRMSGPSGDPSKWIIEPTPTSPVDLNAPILLPKVSDFVLAFHSQTRAIGLIHKLVLPAIKNLVLDFDTGDYTELVDVLVRPATSLSPHSAQEQPRSLLSRLEGLKLAGLPCHPESVDVFYGELQNLTSLNISLSYLHPQFLDLLCTSCTLAGRGDIWLPRLRTLYVSGTSGDVLREVIEKRRSAGVPLESLYVEESCQLNHDDLDWLKQNLKTFELFEGSDDEDEIDFEDLHESEEVDEWSDIEE